MQNIFYMSVQKYVMNVPKNAGSIVIWNIAKNVQKLAKLAQRLAIQGWQPEDPIRMQDQDLHSYYNKKIFLIK